MSVLVDTSVWVEYFRKGSCSEQLERIFDDNLVATNELILAELVPFLKMRNQQRLISLLNVIKKHPIQVHWDQLIEYQYKCLKKGINGIGIPDLIIAQNAKQNDCRIYTLENHFVLIKGILKLELFDG